MYRVLSLDTTEIKALQRFKFQLHSCLLYLRQSVQRGIRFQGDGILHIYLVNSCGVIRRRLETITLHFSTDDCQQSSIFLSLKKQNILNYDHEKVSKTESIVPKKSNRGPAKVPSSLTILLFFVALSLNNNVLSLSD